MAMKKASSYKQAGRGAAKKSTSAKGRSTGTKTSKSSSSRSVSSRSGSSRSTAAESRTASSRSSSSRGTSSARGGRLGASSQPLTDHEEIRRWAEERGATPSCVIGTGGGGDTGMIRLDFPGYSGEGSLQEISWDEWFQKFDENNLALMVQEKTARGQKSNFNKLVKRSSAQSRPRTRAAG
jgi:hypothetical protein